MAVDRGETCVSFDGGRIARDFDLKNLPHEFYDDPYPTYRALREHAPVKWLSANSVFLSRYADIVSAYRNTEAFSSDKKAEFAPKYGEDSRLFRHHTTSLVFNDAPYHTRVRRTIIGGLIPRALARLEPKLMALVDRLLLEAEERGEIDAIADFAAAIPVEVIGDLLAVPNSDRAPLRGWSLAILGALEPVLSAEAFARGEQALAGFHTWLRDLVDDRRKNLGNAEHDVLTRLIQSDGAPLSDDELIENCVFLLNAGHETTSNLIGNAIELFARFPDQRTRLVADPNLLATAIEEVLRYESSNQLGNRVTTCAVEIGGVKLPAGCFVTLGIGAANRDPHAFALPDAFDIGRNPNRHLAFAAGAHQCAGMNLARMEGRIAIAKFLARFPHYGMVDKPVRARRARFRGFTSLPISVHQRD
jgi:cytochrome P450